VNRFFWRWRQWLLLALGLALVGVYLAVNLQREHDQVEAAEMQRLTTQSKVIRDNLTRQLISINLSLESIVAGLPDWERQPNGRKEGTTHLKILDRVMPLVRTFVVLDAQGTVTLSSRDELLGRNFYQREYFQTPLRALNPKTLYVSEPFKSVLNSYVITLSRVRLDAQGQFAGIVLGTIDPTDMKILLNSVRYADDMHVTLVHGAGKVFISEPTLPDVIGRDLTNLSSYFSQQLQGQRDVSQIKGLDSFTGEARLLVLRTFAPPTLAMDKPPVVIVSRALDAVLAHWQRDLQNQLVAYLLLVVLSPQGLLFFQRLQLRRRLVEQRLKLATQASGVGIWEYELRSRRYHWDAAMFDLFGLNPKDVNALNNDWRALLLPGELQRMKDETRATIKSGQAFDMTFQIRRPDGQLRFMHNRAALYRDNLDEPKRLIGATEDITERTLQEADLRLAAMVFDCQESIVVTDPNKVILRVNRAFCAMFGYTADEAIGKTPRLLQSGRHEQPFYAAMWERINREGSWQGEVWNRKKNGDIFPDFLSISAVLNDAGGVTHYVGTHLDITERRASEEAIKQLAFYDPLTGLPNRRLLQDRLQQALNNAKRNQKRLALLFIDLDKFKPVNDDFGHAMGDELLLVVAQRLQTCVRESDTVARVGGDEFVVLLPVIEVAPDALAVAQKIHDALVQPFTLSTGLTVSISSSAGIAIYPEHGSSEAELTQHADAAMYQAKEAGRDRFVVFEATL
jgi:diguanylate cyclase (GGDEF)-like protein/PAS domain S-box-containing protein